MSRSGYVDEYDLEPGEFGRWRGVVVSAIRGKRGQRRTAHARDCHNGRQADAFHHRQARTL